MNGAAQSRRIFKGVSTTQALIRDLLTIVFCQEVLAPGRQLMIVAPWISDVVIFDNQTGAFAALNPEWNLREIRLLDVVVQLAMSGTRVSIVVRPEEHNQSFIRKVREIASDTGIEERLTITEIPELHTKGILADNWLILGSMNLTKNGIEINEEFVTYETARDRIAEAQIHFNAVLGTRRS